MPEEIPLRQYLEILIKSLDDRMQQRFLSMETAISKSEAILSHRLEGMNEFRKQVLEDRDLYATREALEQHIEWDIKVEQNLDERVRRIEQLAANMAGRFWVVGIGTGILIGLVDFFARLILKGSP